MGRRNWVYVNRTADLQKASSEGVNHKDQTIFPSMVPIVEHVDFLV